MFSISNDTKLKKRQTNKNLTANKKQNPAGSTRVRLLGKPLHGGRPEFDSLKPADLQLKEL